MNMKLVSSTNLAVFAIEILNSLSNQYYIISKMIIITELIQDTHKEKKTNKDPQHNNRIMDFIIAYADSFTM